jgi:AhpD family alkylhydroperoxidase
VTNEGKNAMSATLAPQSRMTHPAYVLPDALKALQAFGVAIKATGVSERTLELMYLRASQINGCGVCVDMHPKLARKMGETDERLFAVAAWRDTPFFTEAERAALALAEAVTRVADRADPVPDEVWDAAAAHYDETQMAALVLAIAHINVWNRVNVAVKQMAGGDW